MNISELRTGDRAKCKIYGKQVDDAKVYVGVWHSGPAIWICQNVENGVVSPNLLGYSWSWRVHTEDDGTLDFEWDNVTDFEIVERVPREEVKAEALPCDDGGPAFPMAGEQRYNDPVHGIIKPSDIWGNGFPGMTLRDYFAGQALAGVVSDGDSARPEDIARWSYQYADAMLKVRGKE